MWPQPTWEDYVHAAKESEYVSWVLNNRYYLNHFTISIHELPDGYNDIQQFNEFLESIGIIFNDAGGKVKVSKDGQLPQSASVSNMVNVEFFSEDGTIMNQDVLGSYVEFASTWMVEMDLILVMWIEFLRVRIQIKLIDRISSRGEILDFH